MTDFTLEKNHINVSYAVKHSIVPFFFKGTKGLMLGKNPVNVNSVVRPSEVTIPFSCIQGLIL